MELEYYHYIIAIAGGFVAAILNTLAGYGSLITLSILMDVIGLPGNMANGTNRVNVLAMSVAGTYGYHKNGKLDTSGGKSIIGLVFLGAVCGFVLAIMVSNEQFKAIFKYLLIVIFMAILVNPKKWIHENAEIKQIPLWKAALIYIPIGFYGGFIQMGTGILFLMATVLVSQYTLVKANALKLVTVFVYTIIGLMIFHYKGLVDWKIGAVLAIGQATGGYLTANYASKIENANLYAYRLLVGVVIVVILHTFGIFEMVYGWLF